MCIFKLDPSCQHELEEQMKKEDNKGISLEIHLTQCDPGPGKIWVGKLISIIVLYVSYSQIS